MGPPKSILCVNQALVLILVGICSETLKPRQNYHDSVKVNIKLKIESISY